MCQFDEHLNQKRRSTMSENNCCIGVYDTHTEAENAIKELQKSGFDIKKLSIVGKGYHSEEHAGDFYRIRRR